MRENMAVGTARLCEGISAWPDLW